MLQRYDSGVLGKFERTPSGGVRVPATIGRSGLQKYTNPDGSTRVEYRPPEVVFHADTLATLGGAPVTRGHPGKVTGQNWRKVSLGHVSEKAPQRVTTEGGEFFQADLLIQDADLIADIESGKIVEVSAGYLAEVDETPGMTPDGQRYDAKQTRMVMNHVALGGRDWARAGTAARLRLDGAEVPPDEPEKKPPMKIKFDGVEYESGSDSHISAMQAAHDRQAAEIARLKQDCASKDEALVKARADHALDKTRADSAESALKAVESAAFRADAAAVLGKDYSFEGKDDAAVKRDMIAKFSPAFKLDAKDDLDVVLRVVRAAGPAEAPPKVRHDHNKGVIHQDGAEQSTPYQKHRDRMTKVYEDANKGKV